MNPNSQNYEEAIVFVNATGGRSPGSGTGFLLSLPRWKDSDWLPILVATNRHCVPDDAIDTRVLFNGRGQIEQMPIPAKAWCRSSKDDLAVAAFAVRTCQQCEFTHLPIGACCKEQDFEEGYRIQHMPISGTEYGLGSHTFMVGRFSEYEGTRARLRPVMRFGQVSMLPAEVEINDGSVHLGFFVEMRSVAGFSGSPVFVWSSMNQMGGTVDVEGALPTHPLLLGIHVANVEPVAKIETKNFQALAADLEVTANAGLTLIIPAWRLNGFVETDTVQKLIEKQVREHESAEK